MKFIKNEEIKYLIILTSIIIIAIYFRLLGLGTWGFSSSDEYYIAKTGQNILKFGLPKFETGGFYTRGILYEYISVFLLSIGVKDILAYRLISVIFNLLSVPALYLLIKKISNRKIALASVSLFLFSVLEIEFSRLARFYTTFQTFFIWYVYFLYSYIIEEKVSSRKWMYLLSILSVFVYEGAIFIVILNFLPFIYNFKNYKLKNYILPSSIFIFTFLFLKTNFRNFGVIDYLPTEISLSAIHNYSSTIYLPNVLLTTITENTIWIFPFLLVLGFSGYSLFSFIKGNKTNIVLDLGILFLLIFALLNQFGLVFYIAIILLLTSKLHWKEIFLAKNKLFLYAIIINILFWISYSYFTTEWFSFYPKVISFSIKKVAWMFFNYPNVYEAFILPWLYPVPLQTITIYLLIGLLLLHLIYNNHSTDLYNSHKFLLAVFFLMVIGLSIVVTPYHYARYSFFIYPIMLSLVPISLFYFINFFFSKSIVKTWALTLSVLFFTYISEDFSYNHINNIDSKEIYFRDGFNKYTSGMYYYKEDYETPARIINKNRHKNDIVISLQESIDYYLDKLDYMYKDASDLEFKGRTRLKGTKEIWTNAKLIYKEKDLQEILENRTQTIWLVTFSDNRHYVGNLEKELNQSYKKYLFYTNINNTINVFKIN